MTDHPNYRLAHRAWEAVADSDVAALEKLWSADIVWHVTAKNRWQGEHVGIRDVLEYLAQVGESGDTYDASLDDVLVSDDRVAMVYSVKTRRGVHELETPYVLFGRVRGGQIVEVWTLPFDPVSVDRFWKNSTT